MSNKEQFMAQYGPPERAINAIRSNSGLTYYAAKNANLPHSEMYKIVSNEDDWDGHLGISENGAAPTHIIRKLTSHSDPEVQTNALLHKNVDPNDIDKAVESHKTQPSVINSLVEHSKHLTHQQLYKIAYPPQGKYYPLHTKDKAFDRIQAKEYSDGQ